MNKKQKKMLTRILIAAIMVAALSLVPVQGYLRAVLYMIPYLVIGYDILLKAWKGIRNRQVFDENFLMAVATVGAICLGDFKEGTAVMLFYQIGELFQSYAVGKSRRNISELMDIRPDYANVERNGSLEKVDPDEVEIGSIIVVQPGEKVPIDGIITEGKTTLNTSALTGESLPRDAKEGDEIISGCINMTGVLKIRTTREFGESTVSKILDLVENSSSRIQIRKFYIQICPLLYACSLLQCAGAGNSSAACPADVYGTGSPVGRLGLPCADISGNQLSLRPCDQYSPQLFCRNRRSKQCRCTGKGIQLYGNSCSDQICGV